MISNIFLNNGNVQIGLIGNKESSFTKDIISLSYASPEVILNKDYDEKVDIW